MKKEIDLGLKYSAKQSISILKPVFICMLCTLCVTHITTQARSIEHDREHLYTNDGYKAKFESTQKDTNTTLKSTLISSIFFVGSLIIITLIILLFVYLNWHTPLVFAISLTIFCVFIFVNTFFWFTMLTALDIIVDIPTVAILGLNNAFLAFICVVRGLGPVLMRKFYHIYLSLILAWYLDTLTPTWLGWSMLVLLSLWDIGAVLPKYGPLNLIIKILDKRKQSLPSALIYSTYLEWKWWLTDVSTDLEEDENANNNNNVSFQTSSSSKDESGPKLGIGDFVFYSLLIAKSAAQLNMITVIVCLLSIMVGLLLTIGIVACIGRALPALPISIFVSTIGFFVSELVAVPFYNRLSLSQIFI